MPTKDSNDGGRGQRGIGATIIVLIMAKAVASPGEIHWGALYQCVIPFAHHFAFRVALFLFCGLRRGVQRFRQASRLTHTGLRILE